MSSTNDVCHLEILKGKLIKSSSMKTQVNILKTFSLSRIHFKITFENKVQL
jgi:hypothetical protein